MSTPILVGAPVATPFPGRLILPLAVGVCLLGVLFPTEIFSAIQTWRDSTAYNHCFLIIPIVIYMIWDRREVLTGVAAQPAPIWALAAVPVAAVWLAAERLGIMEGRQLATVTFAEVLFLSVLGPRFWWALCGPLLYLYFLVPFAAFLTPWLQDVTTDFVRHGLDLLGIPAYVDGHVIQIPQGTFFVAEACAGLRFLIASVAFGCLYALVMYRRPARRGAFILASFIVPIIANGIRALGIVYLGYLLNSAQAAAADHIIYGWFFFSFVILMLIVAGLPFREDGMPIASRHMPLHENARWPRVTTAVVIVVCMAGLGPAAAFGLRQATMAEPIIPAGIEIGSGCTTEVRTQTHGARVVCDIGAFDVVWRVFSPHATAGTVMAARWQLTAAVQTESLSESWLANSAWRVMQSNDPPQLMAAVVWVEGRPVRPGLAMRLRMAVDSIIGAAVRPLVMAVTPAIDLGALSPDQATAVQAKLLAFLASQRLDGALQRLAHGP
jgi:exosortase A